MRAEYLRGSSGEVPTGVEVDAFLRGFSASVAISVAPGYNGRGPSVSLAFTFGSGGPAVEMGTSVVRNSITVSGSLSYSFPLVSELMPGW